MQSKMKMVGRPTVTGYRCEMMDEVFHEMLTGCKQKDLKARSHIKTQLNSTVELSWVSVSFDM